MEAIKKFCLCFDQGEVKHFYKIGYSRKEAAIALSISEWRLDRLIKSGELKTFNIGSRVIITAESLGRLTKVGAALCQLH